MGTPRIALCHDWVMTWSGSEQVAGRIAAALGIREVFTFAADPDLARRVFPGRHVHQSRLGTTTFARRRWRWLLPLMPRWWRRLDLGGYDAVVTSSHATVNSIRVRTPTLHISYCYTPMRYAWLWRQELGRLPRPLRGIWPVVAVLLRIADRRRAGNVDLFVAVSHNVAGRIRGFYGKPSLVVHPPVNTGFYTPDPDVPTEDFFLYAGRLVAYKRPQVAVEAAARAGVRLVVAGSGPQLDWLRRIAGPEVEFRVDPSDERLRDLYRRARALVHPGIEDLGMTMVEAQACGTPVIALKEGGAAEAVLDGETGLLYEDASVEGLAAALRSFDPARYDPGTLRRHAERFAPEVFDEAIRGVVWSLAATPAEHRDDRIRELLEGASHGRGQ